MWLHPKNTKKAIREKDTDDKKNLYILEIIIYQKVLLMVSLSKAKSGVEN